MILRSFLAAAGLFLLYNVALQSSALRQRAVVQSQWQGNLLKAQEYPLAKLPRRNVIVGSSLAARLVMEGDFENLAFAGDGPLTGLELMVRDVSAPRVVLIESNLLLREVNQDVIASAYRPGFLKLRPMLPALEDRYQFANLAVGMVGEGMVAKALEGGRRLLRSPQSAGASAEDAGRLLQMNLAIQREKLGTAPDADFVQQCIARMKRAVAELQGRGVRCIFVEMPIDASLGGLLQPALVREQLAAALPELAWIRPEVGRSYRTVDGVHLPKDEAVAYAAYIRAELLRLGF